MIKSKIALVMPLLVLSLIVFAINGCTDRGVDRDNQPSINITMDAGGSTSVLAETVNLVCLTVSARDMEPVTACQAYIGGPLTFELDVPAGSGRLFVLQGINQQLDGQTVLYQGSAVADIEADVSVEVHITVEPIVPLIRFTPFQTVVNSSESFQVNVEAFNLPNTNTTELRFLYDLTLLAVDSIKKGATLGLSDYIEIQVGSNEPGFQVIIGDSEPTGAIVDVDGYSHLATLYLTSQVTVDSTVTALEAVPLSFTTNSESTILLEEVYSQLASVVIRPYTQPVMRLTPAEINVVSGQQFVLDVELFNFTGLDSTFFVLATDPLYVEVDSFTKGLTLDDSDEFVVMQLGGDFPILAPRVGDTTGGTIVDSDGYCHVARAYLSTLVASSDVATEIIGSAGYFYLVGSDSIIIEDVIYPSTPVNIGAFQDRVVTFDDNMLEQAVRSAIGNSVDPILLSQVWPLESISSTFNEIVGLGGIEELVNVDYLNLSHNMVANLTPLSGMTNLRTLYLNTNSITNVSALSSLTNLRFLDLANDPDYSGNDITDLSPLASLMNLQVLDISRNGNLSNLSPLGSLTNLTDLHLEMNNISVLTGLESMTNLSFIDLDYNSITDITPLVNNSGLGTGDVIYLRSNNLSAQALEVDVPALQARGVTVYTAWFR